MLTDAVHYQLVPIPTDHSSIRIRAIIKRKKNKIYLNTRCCFYYVNIKTDNLDLDYKMFYLW